MQFTSNYDSRVVNYERKMFIRLATARNNLNAKLFLCKSLGTVKLLLKICSFVVSASVDLLIFRFHSKMFYITSKSGFRRWSSSAVFHLTTTPVAQNGVIFLQQDSYKSVGSDAFN